MSNSIHCLIWLIGKSAYYRFAHSCMAMANKIIVWGNCWLCSFSTGHRSRDFHSFFAFRNSHQLRSIALRCTRSRDLILSFSEAQPRIFLKIFVSWFLCMHSTAQETLFSAKSSRALLSVVFDYLLVCETCMHQIIRGLTKICVFHADFRRSPNVSRDIRRETLFSW